jgi:hypothetical protein
MAPCMTLATAFFREYLGTRRLICLSTAMAHDYTVVIPVDTTSASSDYETTIGFYNVLNSGNANLANQPLKPNAVTLTRTDLITFQ